MLLSLTTVYTLMALFSLTIILGIILLSYVLTNNNSPKAVVLAHGTIAALGLVLFIVYLFKSPPGPWVSVLLFILATIGGSILLYQDLSGKKISKVLAVGHGLLALAAFILLLVFAFTNGNES